MSIVDENVQNSKRRARYALDNLTTKLNDKHHAKVCCICDRFIMYGDERVGSFDLLKKPVIMKELAKSVARWTEYSLTEEAIEIISDYYTATCLVGISRLEWALKLFLSPKSYLVKDKRGQYKGLGCCVECYGALQGMVRSKNINPVLPTFAIANDLFIGPPPDELTILNDVERCMISLARTDKHVFCFEGGAHKQMIGWHTMFANDVGAVNRTSNWCSQHVHHSAHVSACCGGARDRPASNPKKEVFENLCYFSWSLHKHSESVDVEKN